MKYKNLVKEIDDILLKPLPWGPMMTPRIQAALRQAAELITVLGKINDEMDEKIKYYEGMRSDVKLSRNLTILSMYEKGENYNALAKEFNLTKQRIQKIVSTTKKYVESEHGTARTSGLSGPSDTRLESATGSGHQKDRPANPDRRW